MLALNPDKLTVRDMQASDLVKVVTIEQSLQPSPWGRISFEESLSKQHICRLIVSSESFQVGDISATNQTEEIVAYHVVCPVADELHILNIVVAKHYQGLGIAHMLMHDIVAVADSNENTKKIFLEVRASNTVAQNLYKQWQFKQIGLRKKYYRTGNSEREDALVLMRVI